MFNTKFIHGAPYEYVKGRIDADENFWNAVKGNLTFVTDITAWEDICHKEVKPVIEDSALTEAAADLLPAEPWNEETFNLWVNEVKAKTGKKGKDLFHPIRKALTAQENGPELKILMPLMGRAKAYKRLKGEAA